MINRIEKTFINLKADGKKALVSFITAGDPNMETSEQILNDLPKYGVDIIEVGIPFSDPMADGPIIQRSSQRAISAGFNLSKIFTIIRNFRKTNLVTPIVLMGYFNPIYQFGLKKFFTTCQRVGIDGIIIVDLPPEENNLVNSYTKEYNVHNIRLITPTTNKDRLNKILKFTSGFLYYVSITGITGTKKPSVVEVKNAVSRIKNSTTLPVVVGFGINNSKQIQELNKFSDGCVVGSAIVRIIEDQKAKNKSQISKKIQSFLTKLKREEK